MIAVPVCLGCTILIVAFYRAINDTMTFIQFVTCKLCAISKSSQRAPDTSRLSFLSVVGKVSGVLALCASSTPTLTVCNDCTIASIALSTLHHLLATPLLSIPHIHFCLNLTFAIILKFLSINSPLRTQFTIPNEPPLYREIVLSTLPHL